MKRVLRTATPRHSARWRLLTVTLFCGFLLTGFLGSDTGTIVGHVYDQDYSPVEGAVVFTEPATSTTSTNEWGYFELFNVPGGVTYTITAMKAGYDEKSTTTVMASGGCMSNPGTNEVVIFPLKKDIPPCTAPRMEVSEQHLSFDVVAPDDSLELILTIRNVAEERCPDLTWSLSLDGADANHFSINSEVSGWTPAGHESHIRVAFTPTFEGANNYPSATLRINSNAGNETVALSGTRKDIALIAVEPEFVDFGTITPDASSSVVVKVKNVGVGRLHVTSVTMYGPDLIYFYYLSFGGERYLSPGEDFSITLQFNRRDDYPSTREATFVINSNAVNAPILEIPMRAVVPEG